MSTKILSLLYTRTMIQMIIEEWQLFIRFRTNGLLDWSGFTLSHSNNLKWQRPCSRFSLVSARPEAQKWSKVLLHHWAWKPKHVQSSCIVVFAINMVTTTLILSTRQGRVTLVTHRLTYEIYFFVCTIYSYKLYFDYVTMSF